MIFWLDAQLSPKLARWLNSTFGVVASPVRDLGLRDSSDHEIYQAAAMSGATVITKDSDFVHLQIQHGPPPQILWLTCGNTSQAGLHAVFLTHFVSAKKLLEAGEALVEIKGS
jgi:predicted nuclease of predicted toxin-antitoxin system